MTGQDNPGQRTVVVGVGNEFRRDDGAGLEVIARLRALQPGDASLTGVTLALSDGEPGEMIDLWEGARLAVVIDAVRDTTMPPGHRYQLATDGLGGVADDRARLAQHRSQRHCRAGPGARAPARKAYGPCRSRPRLRFRHRADRRSGGRSSGTGRAGTRDRALTPVAGELPGRRVAPSVRNFQHFFRTGGVSLVQSY